jgi:hypothetical protein
MRVQQDEPFAGLHQLAGHDEHLLDAPADFRLDDRAQFRAHRADDILRGARDLRSTVWTRTVADGSSV